MTLWQTLRQVMKHGLDYKHGNPIKRILGHLKQLIETYEAEEKQKRMKKRKRYRSRK